jgi:hypothetical protein
LASCWFSSLPIQEIFICHDFRTRTSADSRIPQTPDFMGSQIHDSGSSQVRDFRSFAGSKLYIFISSRLQSFAGSRFQIFTSSRLRSFAGSRFQIFAGSRFLKTHFTNFVELDVSRVTGFAEFPNNGERQRTAAVHRRGTGSSWGAQFHTQIAPRERARSGGLI